MAIRASGLELNLSVTGFGVQRSGRSVRKFGVPCFGSGVFFGRFGQTFFVGRFGQALFQFDLRQAIGEVPFPGLRVCSKL